MRHEIYGPGGFDPGKPGGNVIAVEELPDPDPQPDPPTALADQVASLTNAVDTLILDQLGGFDV